MPELTDGTPVLPDSVRSLRPTYRSGKDVLGRDFFAPCLAVCTRYRRVTGYFRSSALVTWASFLPRLIAERDLKILLLAGPYLSAEDRQALAEVATPEQLQQVRQRTADNFIIEALALGDAVERPDVLRLLLLWLLANGHLEIKFGFPIDPDDNSLFHEKIGIFDFPSGEKVAFQGSANETKSGHVNNYESVDVYRSWVADDKQRVGEKEQQFAEIWNAKPREAEILGVSIESLSPAVIERIKTMAPEECPVRPRSKSQAGPAALPDEKWRHQEEAVKAFLARKRGIFEMATGTGKTRTALILAERLVAAGLVSTIIVAADGIDLMNQWVVSYCPNSLRG